VNDNVCPRSPKEYPAMFKATEIQPQQPAFPANGEMAVSARLVSYQELRESGWTKGMVVKFLGAAWRSYSLDEVEAAEAHPQFRNAWSRALQKRCGLA
jgi:hypothetical protein